MKPSKFAGVVFSCLLFCLMIAGNSQAISILEEKKLAEEYVKMIRHSSVIMEDPIVNHMVKKVGQHLLSFAGEQPFDYNFYVVNEDVFNAFAAPGAQLFFYRGLITSLDSIDEFAGIVSHELSHAVSRHVSEAIDRSKYISLGSLAGILAGGIIGSQSGGETGTTIIKGSMALAQTAMLSFTRENETEADEKAIMFLKKSCFSPEGLMTGLMKIRNADFRGIEQIPEYVKTHPGTGNRIAHTEAILSGYTPKQDKAACPEDFRFDMVKYRLLGLYADLDTTFEKLTALEKQGPPNAALHYGLGLLYERKFMPDKALLHYKKALSINIFDPMILLEMGRLYLANGSPEKALQVLQGIESDPVVGIMARFQQASAYLELHELSKAKNGFDFVINKAAAAYPQAYLKIANIYSIENNQGLSAYNLGLYYSKTGKDKTAIVHLTRALNTLSDESLIKATKELLDQLKKEAAKQNQP